MPVSCLGLISRGNIVPLLGTQTDDNVPASLEQDLQCSLCSRDPLAAQCALQADFLGEGALVLRSSVS